MIIVDTVLQAREREGNPINDALLGAGFQGRGLVNHIEHHVPGMRVAGVFSRNPQNAAKAYREAGIRGARETKSVTDVHDAIVKSEPVFTGDASILCQAEGIDAVVECTGSVEFGAQAAMLALENGKHVLLNAELDSTVGPALKRHGDRAGVVVSACDGDQPGTEMNLYRFVKGMGMVPLMCGNIKALLDVRRTPETQRGFAEKWRQNPVLCTSFADGSKISFEQSVVANATGMRVARRGMLGCRHDGHVDELTTKFDVDELRALGGIVDYVIGSRPSPGVFILAASDDKVERQYLNMYKMGEGPLYCLYAPTHLCHMEAPFSIARAVLMVDPTAAPQGRAVVDVIAVAKRRLEAGERLDGAGGYTVYGQCENADTVQAERLLPLGISEGCELIRTVEADQALTYDDVRVPPGRCCDRLRAEQDALFVHETEAVLAHV
jgi:predicted homoserine dehydrogenase-like protein